MKCDKCGCETESLAVLADRKGVYITRQKHHGGYVWYINFDAPPETRLTDEQFDGLMTRYDGDTYAAAEAKARAYLEGLDDVREGKK